MDRLSFQLKIALCTKKVNYDIICCFVEGPQRCLLIELGTYDVGSSDY